MRQTTTKNGSLLFTFESTADVEAVAAKHPYTPGGGGDWEFVGRELLTFRDASEASRSLWDYGKKVLDGMVQDLLDAKLPEPKDTRRRTRFHEDNGDELDLDRLRSGQPYWRLAEREDCQGQQTVTVLVDCCAVADVPSDAILWPGAAAVALACLLEEKGYRVELWALTSGHGRFEKVKEKVVTACRLKRPEDPLDRSSLTNAVCGWYFRTVVFTLLRSLAREVGTVATSGLGNSEATDPGDLRAITSDECRIHVSSTYSRSGAVALVRHELEKFASH